MTGLLSNWNYLPAEFSSKDQTFHQQKQRETGIERDFKNTLMTVLYKFQKCILKYILKRHLFFNFQSTNLTFHMLLYAIISYY